MSGGSSEASASPAVETDTVTKETEKREEPSSESSIERAPGDFVDDRRAA